MPETDEQGRDMSAPTDVRCFLCGVWVDATEYNLHTSWHNGVMTEQVGSYVSGGGNLYPGMPIDGNTISILVQKVSELDSARWNLEAKCMSLEAKIATLEAANNVVSMGLTQVEAVIGTEGDFRFVEKPAPPVKVTPLANPHHVPYVAWSSNG